MSFAARDKEQSKPQRPREERQARRINRRNDITAVVCDQLGYKYAPVAAPQNEAQLRAAMNRTDEEKKAGTFPGVSGDEKPGEWDGMANRAYAALMPKSWEILTERR